MITSRQLAAVRKVAQGRSVVVVGDLMLDEFLSGSVERISPEAPVPVLAYESNRYVLGGAGNSALSLMALGAQAGLVGLVGGDIAGRALLAEVSNAGLDGRGIVVAPRRSTTLKTRIVAHTQQIVRVDREAAGPIGPAVRRELRDAALAAVSGADAVLISDYDKGALPATLGREIVELCRARKIPCGVDSKAGHTAYRGATVLTPNTGELAKMARMHRLAHGDVARAAAVVLRRFAPEALLVTRAEDGMSLFVTGAERVDVPALSTQVRDVTGAGDTVAAVMALGLASGLDIADAARLATVAAAVVVRKSGTAAPSWDEMAALVEE